MKKKGLYSSLLFQIFIMVRYKKRYFVVEYERTKNILKDQYSISLDFEQLNSKDIDVANAIKEKILELPYCCKTY